MRDLEFWQQKLVEANSLREDLLMAKPTRSFFDKPPRRVECQNHLRWTLNRYRWVQQVKAYKRYHHDLAKLDRQIAYYNERIGELSTRASRILRKPVI